MMAYTQVRVLGYRESEVKLNMAHNQRDQMLFGYLTKLRRHLIKCDKCRGARKALNFDSMCDDAKLLTLSAADEFDQIIELRRMAHAHGTGVIYACPDIAAHGESYALTARPFEVHAVQDGLF